MTDKDKLQKLFQAALAAPEPEVKAPARAFPAADAAPAPFMAMPVAEVAPPSSPFVAAPETAAPVQAERQLVKPMAQAGLSDKESEELGRLIDERRAKLRRKARRSALVMLAIFLLGSGGTFGWFIQSPARVQAFREAMRDIRSYGDVSGMVAQYKLALDKIAVRSKQIDQATMAMGVSADQSKAKDVYMDAEMKEFMGPNAKGKTVGERNRLMQQNFGDMKNNKMLQKAADQVKEQTAAAEAKATGAEAKPPEAGKKPEASFDWK